MYAFPKMVTLLITAKQTPQLSLLLFRFVAFHYDMKFIAAFFFFKGFSAKQQKSQRKKKSLRAKCIKRQLYGKYYKIFASKNDRQDKSWTGQAHNQAGHCSLTSHYFEPCKERITSSDCMLKTQDLIVTNVLFLLQ